jgi:hypothetical protein
VSLLDQGSCLADAFTVTDHGGLPRRLPHMGQDIDEGSVPLGSVKSTHPEQIRALGPAICRGAMIRPVGKHPYSRGRQSIANEFLGNIAAGGNNARNPPAHPEPEARQGGALPRRQQQVGCDPAAVAPQAGGSDAA